MTVSITPYVENVNEEIAAGYTQLKLYRDTEPDGAFSSLIDTATLVADTLEYEIEDATGAATHWYRYGFYNPSTLTLTTLSDPTRPDVTRFIDVILDAVERAGAGFKSTCTSAGSVSQLIDATLRDQGTSDDYLASAYLYRPDAADATDELRRLRTRPFATSSGGLSPIRDWANLPAEDEVYYCFLLLPPFKMAGAPYSWADAARDGLQACEFQDLVDVGTGTSTRTTRFDLATFLGFMREGDVRNVYLRRYDDDGLVLSDLDAGKGGRFWDTEPNGRGSLTLIVKPAPTAQQHILVEANRRDAELYGADDITSCPLRLASRATVWKAYEYLNTVHLGKYAGELASAYAAFLEEYTGEAVKSVVNL